ncbi:SCP [Musa troglodytarum]|uniref:SCP n=2 Tax=Musa troglodytarum TaxID=320322 RepID=A0A9E7FRZ8_9LILI|nr:SCP [Musa troglodytarum]URE06040.1 SCP [Musa troglodytarum]
MAVRSEFLLLCSVMIALVLVEGTEGVRRPRAGLVGQLLRSHNAARAAVGLPPLAWDARLARYAESYAGRRRRDCALAHSGGPYGENIFWGSGARWRPAQAAAAWVRERRWYHYRSNSCSAPECGHYTQIVWRSTRRLGCAMVSCSGRKGVLVVCEYDPPGNYIGERPY